MYQRYIIIFFLHIEGLYIASHELYETISPCEKPTESGGCSPFNENIYIRFLKTDKIADVRSHNTFTCFSYGMYIHYIYSTTYTIQTQSITSNVCIIYVDRRRILHPPAHTHTHPHIHTPTHHSKQPN